MHLRALLLMGVALAVLPLACTTQDENPDWSPGTDYPDWAYNAPVYLKPAEELQPKAKVGNNIPVYYTRDALFFVKHPQGRQQDVYPHVAVWGSDTAGRQWAKAGYFGLEQTHFLYKADHDGGYWVRFVGPGQGVTEVPPGQPHRIYVVDTHAPDIQLQLDPAAWYCPEHCGCASAEKDDCGENKPGQPEGKPCNPRCKDARPHIYRVGDVVTLSWDVSDANLKKNTVKLSTCFAKFPHNLVWSEFPETLPTSGSMKITIPPEAAHQAGLRFRIVAEDLAGNIGLQMTDVMQVRGREGMPLEDQLAEAPPAMQPAGQQPPAGPAADAQARPQAGDLPDPDAWSPDRKAATEADQPTAMGPAADAVPADTPPHAVTPRPAEPVAQQPEPTPAETPQPVAKTPDELPSAESFQEPERDEPQTAESLLEPIELKPQPGTSPQPQPEPVAQPQPTPAPQPVATPEPQPRPEPVATPQPQPQPEPSGVTLRGKDPIETDDETLSELTAPAEPTPAPAEPEVRDVPAPPEPAVAPVEPVAEAPAPEKAPQPQPLPGMHEQRKLAELTEKLAEPGPDVEPGEPMNPAADVVAKPRPEPSRPQGPAIVLDEEPEKPTEPEVVEAPEPVAAPAEPEVVEAPEPVAAPSESEVAEAPEPVAAPKPVQQPVSVLDMLDTSPRPQLKPVPIDEPAPAAKIAEAQPKPAETAEPRPARVAPLPADVPVLTDAEAPAETSPPQPKVAETSQPPAEPVETPPAEKTAMVEPPAAPAPPKPDEPLSGKVDWIDPQAQPAPAPKAEPAEPTAAAPTPAPRQVKPDPTSRIKKVDRWEDSPIVREAPRPTPAPAPQPEVRPTPAPAKPPVKVASAPKESTEPENLDELLEQVKTEDQARRAETAEKPASPAPTEATVPHQPAPPATAEGPEPADSQPEPAPTLMAPSKEPDDVPEGSPTTGRTSEPKRLSDIPEKVQQGWPAPGMVMRGGVSRLLNWVPAEARNYRVVKLQFSANDGSKWMTVAEGLRVDQAVMWTVPVVTSSSCRLRVVAMDPKGKEVILETSPRFTVDTGAWKTVDMSGFKPEMQSE